MNAREIKVRIFCEGPVVGPSLVSQSNEMYLFWTVHTRAWLKTLLITRWQLTSITFQTTSYQSAVATLGESALIIRIHEDHRGMVKFDDKSENDYKSLENHIVKMINAVGQRRPFTADGGHEDRQRTFSQSHFPLSSGSSPERGNDSANQWQTLSPPGPSQTISYNYFGDNPSHTGRSGMQVNQHRAGISSCGHNTYQNLYGA